MNILAKIELFTLKCAAINADIKQVLSKYDSGTDSDIGIADHLKDYIKQFDLDNRINVEKMAQYYSLFYMIENDIRSLISETLLETRGPDWWESSVPQAVKEEASKNKKREFEAGVTLRSTNDIDYITFGQLGEIIKSNWDAFAGMLSNQSALNRVIYSLNMSRGAIAHCGLLADDEIDRLKLNVKDWFRVLAGPT